MHVMISWNKKMDGTNEEKNVNEFRRRIPQTSLIETKTEEHAQYRLRLQQLVRSFCSISTLNFAKILFILVTIGSLVFEFCPPSESYFGNKQNAINQYFVKLAWGWTVALYTPLIVFSGTTGVVSLLEVCKGLFRVLVVGTAVWYFWVRLIFHTVMQVTGACIGNHSLTDVRACIQAGHHWSGFDISGHCFLLIYSAVLIHEEMRIVQNSTNSTSKNCGTELNTSNHTVAASLLLLFTVLLILLELLWVLMLMMTSIYFHIWTHKLVGTLIAFASWYGTYNLWYRTEFSPGS